MMPTTPTRTMSILLALTWWMCSAAAAAPQQGLPAGPPPLATAPPPLPAIDPTRPTLFLIGDSTMKVGAAGQMGWGEAVGEHFDLSRINLVNYARGGRSSRTFLTEGLWIRALSAMRPGPLVKFLRSSSCPRDDIVFVQAKLNADASEHVRQHGQAFVVHLDEGEAIATLNENQFA